MNEPKATKEASRTTRNQRFLGRVFVLVFGAAAIGCSVFTLLSCEFFHLTAAFSTKQEFTMEGGIGLFSFQDPEGNGMCIHYNDLHFWDNSEWMNELWVVARYASITAPILGACAWLVSVSEFMLGRFCGSFMIPVVFYILACLAQGCTFFMYGQRDVCLPGPDASDNLSSLINGATCQLSVGAYLSIAAGITYYIVSVLLCCIPRPDPFCQCIRRPETGSNNSKCGGSTTDGPSNIRDVTSSDFGTDVEDPEVVGVGTSSTSSPQWQRRCHPIY